MSFLAGEGPVGYTRGYGGISAGIVCFLYEKLVKGPMRKGHMVTCAATLGYGSKCLPHTKNSATCKGRYTVPVNTQTPPYFRKAATDDSVFMVRFFRAKALQYSSVFVCHRGRVASYPAL